MNGSREIVILGGSGEMGRLFAGTLAMHDFRITTADLSNDCAEQVAAHITVDLSQPSARVCELLGSAECVLVTLPEPVALSCATWVLGEMKYDALWVDTLSVKTEICGILESVDNPAERLSLNPMFAPKLGFRGQIVAAVELASREKTREFLRILNTAGAVVRPVSAKAHDAATGSIQVATHAAILSFGVTLLRLGYDALEAWKLATPPHRILLAALNRIVRGNPEVYWSIQALHPQANRIRTEFTQACAGFDQTAGCDSPVELERLFGQLDKMLAPLHGELDHLTDRVVLATRDQEDPGS